MNKKESPAATGHNQNVFNDSNYPSNTRADQRSTLKGYLKIHGSLTTLEARRELDILHPAGRIMELRQGGCNIITTWQDVPTTGGRTHRVARYVWRGEAVV